MFSPLLLVIVAGGLGGVGLWLIAARFLPRTVRLDDALAALSRDFSEPAQGSRPVLVQDSNSRLERIAADAYQRFRIPISSEVERNLVLQGRSIADFVAEKLVFALVGALLPVLVWWCATQFGFGWSLAVGGAVLVGAVGGFLVPDLKLRGVAQRSQHGASEALAVFFDLVALERLANASAVQALSNAAELSDVPVFVSVRAVLEQARLQQRPPWDDLHRLSADLELPELSDIADIMALDEQGAALAGVLRARVKELRKAQLAKRKIQAQAAAESLTVWMVLPVLIFALTFLIPPLLKLIS